MSFKGNTDFKSANTRKETNASKNVTGTNTDQLQLDNAAIQKIITDVLGGTSGLASIFGGAQKVGLFDSTVANQAAGNLAANIIGELAKITGKTVHTIDQQQLDNSLTKQNQSSTDTSFGFNNNIGLPGGG